MKACETPASRDFNETGISQIGQVVTCKSLIQAPISLVRTKENFISENSVKMSSTLGFDILDCYQANRIHVFSKD